MYIVTNREIDESQHDENKAFGKKSASGPNELRLAEVLYKDNQRYVNILPDQITSDMAISVGLDPQKKHYASAYVARKIQERCTVTKGDDLSSKAGKNLLLFVHGYNNDMTDVLNRAEMFEKNYNVEVLCFSWPANGGGFQGVLSYKSDKRDALASIGALDRVFDKMEQFIKELNSQYIVELEARAEKKFSENAEAWDRYFSKEVNKRCPYTVNLLLHSMGNYLFKYLLKDSIYSANNLLFDNVILAAPDTNNENHAEWVDKIQFRNRVYITINEKDSALKASRMKMGEKQKARLGHYLKELNSKVATYIDFTDEPYVGDSHAYFEGSALKNKKIAIFFKNALNGEIGENSARYDSSRNVYRL